MGSEELREPVGEALEQIINIIAEAIEKGKNNNEFDNNVNPHTVATMVMAVVQGGYVLARGENSVKAFEEAVSGAIDMLGFILNNSNSEK